MNGRVYDPAVGRFLSADPYIQDPSDLQSYNRYSYAFNNPTRWADPSGFDSENPVIKEPTVHVTAPIYIDPFLDPFFLSIGFGNDDLELANIGRFRTTVTETPRIAGSRLAADDYVGGRGFLRQPKPNPPPAVVPPPTPIVTVPVPTKSPTTTPTVSTGPITDNPKPLSGCGMCGGWDPNGTGRPNFDPNALGLVMSGKQTAWTLLGAAAVGWGLPALIDALSVGVESTVANGATTALSEVRYTQAGEEFIRYESANPAFSRVTSSGGVKPGTYAAPVSDGVVPIGQRASTYNLPDPHIPRTNYVTIQPPAGTPIIGPRPVVGGTGNEVLFPFGF